MLDSKLPSINSVAQRSAARISSGPLVILAGAGTGKTRVTSRAAFAIETGVVSAGKALLVTFTAKAVVYQADYKGILQRSGFFCPARESRW